MEDLMENLKELGEVGSEVAEALRYKMIMDDSFVEKMYILTIPDKILYLGIHKFRLDAPVFDYKGEAVFFGVGVKKTKKQCLLSLKPSISLD